MPCLLNHSDATLTRRESLAVLGGAAGATAFSSGHGMAALLPEGAFTERMLGLHEATGGSGLGTIKPFTLTGKDLPWSQQLMAVEAGQEVTFLLAGCHHCQRIRYSISGA